LSHSAAISPSFSFSPDASVCVMTKG